MIETFKTRLKAKYPGVNLSQKRIDAIADRLHKKFPDITEESDHDAKIEDYYDEETVKEIAKEDDRIRTLEAKAKEPQKEEKKEEKKDEKPPEEMPAWFKPYAEKLQKQEQQEAAITRRAKLAELFKKKDVPEKFWGKMQLPEKEEDFEAHVESVSKDYAELVPTFKPGKGGNETGGKKVDEKQINSLVDSMMNIQTTQQN